MLCSRPASTESRELLAALLASAASRSAAATAACSTTRKRVTPSSARGATSTVSRLSDLKKGGEVHGGRIDGAALLEEGKVDTEFEKALKEKGTPQEEIKQLLLQRLGNDIMEDNYKNEVRNSVFCMQLFPDRLEIILTNPRG